MIPVKLYHWLILPDQSMTSVHSPSIESRVSVTSQWAAHDLSDLTLTWPVYDLDDLSQLITSMSSRRGPTHDLTGLNVSNWWPQQPREEVTARPHVTSPWPRSESYMTSLTSPWASAPLVADPSSGRPSSIKHGNQFRILASGQIFCLKEIMGFKFFRVISIRIIFFLEEGFKFMKVIISY